MIFLIDGDNNVNTGINGIELLTKDDTVLIFHHKSMVLNKLIYRAKQSQANVRFIESVMNAKNSIDFQIVAELGILIGRGDVDCAYIISHDKDYEPPIESLRARYSDCFCEIGLRDDIESCLKFAYVLRAKTADELVKSLVSECGESWGNMLYTHLKDIFTNTPVDELPTVVNPEDENAESSESVEANDAKMPISDSEQQEYRPSRNSRRKRGGRRGDRRREETVEQPVFPADAEVAEETVIEAVVEPVEELVTEPSVDIVVEAAESTEEIEVEIYEVQVAEAAIEPDTEKLDSLEEDAVESVGEELAASDAEPVIEPTVEMTEPILEVVIEPVAEAMVEVAVETTAEAAEPTAEKPKRSRRGRKPKSESVQPTEETPDAAVEQSAETAESADSAPEKPKASRRKSRPRRKKTDTESEISLEAEQNMIPEPEELPELPMPEIIPDVE